MFKRNNLFKLFAKMLLLVFLCSFTTTKAKVIYVDDDAQGANDGSSWDNAFIHLQDALGNANSSQGTVEIRVAQGIYVPYPDVNEFNLRKGTFQLINDVNIIGGFAGLGTINPDERDFEAYQTILSGDINGDDVDVNDTADLEDDLSRENNCYHIVSCNSNSVLDGFTITGGYANGSPILQDDTKGSAIYNTGSPTIKNCTFIYNYANIEGGAVYSLNGDMNFENCVFTNNFASDNGGSIYSDLCNLTFKDCTFTENHSKYGGAICNMIPSHISDSTGFYSTEDDTIQINVKLENCTFKNNSATWEGGGIYSEIYTNRGSKADYFPALSLDINNSSFDENSAIYGGGIFIEDSPVQYSEENSTQISNCSFTNNNSSMFGGGIYFIYSTNHIIKCLFSNNSSDLGGAIYSKSSTNNISESVFWGNSADCGGGIRYNPYEGGELFITNCTAAWNSAMFSDWGDFISGVNPHITNSIIWYCGRHNPIDLDGIEGPSYITYCNIQGGWEGEGNIDVDPMFIDALGPDQVGGTEDDDLRLSPSSPCIDSGDPEYISLSYEKDIDANPRVASGRIDMGAYEFQNVIYVDDDANGLNDGSSWENAFCYLQDALNSVDTGYQIHVAQGTYTPDLGFSLDENINDIRESTFTLKNDTALLGGFAGLLSDNPDARDYNLYETILSGDLNGDDVDVNIPNEPMSNPNELIDIPSKYDNCYHVVTSDEINENSVLNGFIIKGGYGNGIDNSNRRGAGLYNINGNPTIINCSFINNIAQNAGGGIYNEMSIQSLTNCTFIKNYVLHEGGALYNNKSSLTLTNCNLQNNSTVDENFSYGGAIHNQESNLYLRNCTIKNNYAFIGGGIYNTTPSMSTNWDSDSAFTPDWVFDINDIDNSIQIDFEIENCIFINNNTPYSGGAIYNYFGHISNIPDTAKYEFDIKTSSIIANSTFISNNGGKGGGLYLDYNKTFITNCLFSGNTAESGGGIYSRCEELLIMNCTSVWDSASNTYGDFLVGTSADILNSIIWYCDDPLEHNGGYQSSLDVDFSDIQGGWTGQGNIDEDPLFVEPLGHDNQLGTGDEDLRLAPMSPCVDSGQLTYEDIYPETDHDGNPRIFGDNIDMGAYEFQGNIYVDDDAYLSDTNSIIDGSITRPFSNIQEAIDIAKDEYTINVFPGVYDKINYLGKAITVTGFGGAATIQASGDAVTFHSGEDSNSILKNFILCNSDLGISLNYGSSPTIHNITIANNLFGIAAYEDSNPDIRNCIFYNNVDGDLFGCESWFSCIESGGLDKHNFYFDPLFVDAINGDYHLKSEGWRWSENSESWTWDEVTSFCIDAGDQNMSLGDEPMSIPRDPNNLYGKNTRINVGAYGGTLQASMPPSDWIPINNDDFTPPSPNPARFANLQSTPHEVINDTKCWIEMKATTATDASGYVEYFFDCVSDNNYSSGWQTSPSYSVYVGRSGQFLAFKVKARDLYMNETEWSGVGIND